MFYVSSTYVLNTHDLLNLPKDLLYWYNCLCVFLYALMFFCLFFPDNVSKSFLIKSL